MFENFTEGARRALSRARDETCEFRHSFIGTEHILLALAQPDSEVSTLALSHFGIDYANLRSAIAAVTARGKSPSYGPELSRRSKKAMALAAEEAGRMGDDCVGTEHLLIGLLLERECLAAGILTNLGFGLKEARAVVRGLRDAPTGTDPYLYANIAARRWRAISRLYDKQEAPKMDADINTRFRADDVRHVVAEILNAGDNFDTVVSMLQDIRDDSGSVYKVAQIVAVDRQCYVTYPDDSVLYFTPQRAVAYRPVMKNEKSRMTMSSAEVFLHCIPKGSLGENFDRAVAECVAIQKDSRAIFKVAQVVADGLRCYVAFPDDSVLYFTPETASVYLRVS